MADPLQFILGQRRLAQQKQEAERDFQYRMMQQRALDGWRQQQAAMQAQAQAQAQQRFEAQQRLLMGNQARADLREQRRAEAERASRERLELEIRRGKLQPGYRWKTPDSTEQELIPGGAEWTKQRAAHAGDLNKLQSIGNSIEEFTKVIDYILDPKNASGFSSNFGGWNAYLTRLLPNVIPGFARTSDVSSAVDRLTEMAETTGLSSIRGGSGQSVGAITEREWPKFAAQLLKLSPRLEEDTARKVLGDARATALDMRNRELRAYESEWGPSPFMSKDPLGRGAAPDAPPPGVDPKDWKYLTPAEKAKWRTKKPQ